MAMIVVSCDTFPVRVTVLVLLVWIRVLVWVRVRVQVLVGIYRIHEYKL